MSKLAAKFTSNINEGTRFFEANAKTISKRLVTPDDRTKKNIGNTPYYSTGGRTFIKIGGKAIGMAQSFDWRLSYNATPIYTLDSLEAWDIDIGRLSVTGSLSQIIDPTKGPESDNLFAIMKAAVHQPMVEIQALDASGTSIFFARGMFVGVNGSTAKGQVSSIKAEFVGTLFQHYVSQQFQPYSGFGALLGKSLGKLKNLASGATGGLL